MPSRCAGWTLLELQTDVGRRAHESCFVLGVFLKPVRTSYVHSCTAFSVNVGLWRHLKTRLPQVFVANFTKFAIAVLTMINDTEWFQSDNCMTLLELHNVSASSDQTQVSQQRHTECLQRLLHGPARERPALGHIRLSEVSLSRLTQSNAVRGFNACTKKRDRDTVVCTCTGVLYTSLFVANTNH
jgi:hypothetical protein